MHWPKNVWRVKVSREQAGRRYASVAAADSATVTVASGCSPGALLPSGSQGQCSKHTAAFLRGCGAADWDESQICSQRLIHNS